MSDLSFNKKLLGGAEVDWVRLGDVCIIKTGPNINKKVIAENPGPYPVINSGREPLGFVDRFNVENDPIGIASRGSVGLVTWTPNRFFRGNLNYSCTPRDATKLNARFLYHYLLFADAEIQALATHQGIPALNAGALKTLKVPIPCPEDPEKSLAIQGEIARILDSFNELTTELTSELTAELEARTKQYIHYRDELLTFEDNEFVWKALGDTDFFQIDNSGRRPIKASLRKVGTTPYYGANNIQGYVEGCTHDGEFVLIAEDGSASLENYSIQYATGKFWANNHVHVVRGKDKVNTRYLFHFLSAANFQPYLSGGGRAKLTKGRLVEICVPVPFPDEPERSLAVQGEIARTLDKFDTLTTSLSRCLPREIELRQQQYEYFRDLLLGFPGPTEAAQA